MARRHFQEITQDDLKHLLSELARASLDMQKVLQMMKDHDIDSVMADGLKTCIDSIRRYDNLTREVGLKALRIATAQTVAEIQAQYMADQSKE